MKRGFSATSLVVANCGQCDMPYGPCGGSAEFSSIDEAMDFFIDGADGWSLYGDRLMCPVCLPLSLCFNPGHDWRTSIGVLVGGATLVARQCSRCGLYVAEVLA